MTLNGPVVYKFGGSSVADAGRILHVAGLAARGPERLVVVVSALGGTTDDLVMLGRMAGDTGERLGEAHAILEKIRVRHETVVGGLTLAAGEEEELLDRVVRRLAAVRAEVEGRSELEGNARTDSILSAGEDLSAQLLAAAIRARGRDAMWFDARRVVRTDRTFGKGMPRHDVIRERCEEHLSRVLETGTVAVVQGFVGATASGETTTLGRGGGDYSAALLGGCMDAEVVHIWTDVQGILSGDPRVIAEPRLLEEIGFEEAVELASFGAKVIHPGAAIEAGKRNIPLRIRSTFDPDHEGTLIRSDKRGVAEVAAIASKSGVAIIKVRSLPTSKQYGWLAKVFDVLARRRTPVDLVAASHWGTAFTVDQTEDLDAIVQELQPVAEVELVRDVAAVTVVGHGFMQEPGMDALVFWAVGKTPVHLIAQASDVSLSFIVDQDEVPDLLRRLHESLIELPWSAAVVPPTVSSGGST